jgi:hypothetical protein
LQIQFSYHSWWWSTIGICWAQAREIAEQLAALRITTTESDLGKMSIAPRLGSPGMNRKGL